MKKKFIKSSSIHHFAVINQRLMPSSKNLELGEQPDRSGQPGQADGPQDEHLARCFLAEVFAVEPEQRGKHIP